ncbi:hypothetical protein PtA15_8A104 [Puccinia triticina]|uniref:Uncharacterized protein n=1 Tax=Puccinia triticina TaxID=208348 RepID=A0ABY7CPM5_9BASI|nr:uncharacterized protein PtA15_8A104 [Puccinia triticina]WAQ87203.1 hypothetical protein PtA15_8A104 [Puccinia triticina]
MSCGQSNLPVPLSDLIRRPQNPEPHPNPSGIQKSSRKRKKQQPPAPLPPTKNRSSGTQVRQIRNLPGADGRHHPLPSTALPSAIDNLEQVANQTSSEDHHLSLHEALNSIAPKKTGKRLRTREEDGRVPQPEPLTDEEVLSHTAVRRPNRWNRFLQQLSARNKFRGVGKGVGRHRVGMAEISVLYKRYRARKKIPGTDNSNTTPASRSPSPEAELTPSELALDDDSDTEQDSHAERASPPASDLRGSISLARAASTVESYLANWVIQANSIAQTCNCKMILFAVSTHLGRHSFQITKSTHRAVPFVDLADNVDQPNTYPARFQASLVGTTPSETAKPKTPPRRVRPPRPNVTDQMIAFAVAKTNNAINHWLWSNNQCALASAGYRLVTDPRMRTPVEKITSPSCWLTVKYIRSLYLDLDDGYINLLPLEPATP